MFKNIKSRRKSFVLLQLSLFFIGLFLGGLGVYMDSTILLGWMLWLVSGAFLFRGVEMLLLDKQRSIGYFLIGSLYLCVTLFYYPVW
ncbi:hypothetical protein [Sutcliffiella deserti]|uniref:hypothetical protein n=1 Tax=Sutcliffiella deserti TaxID=2875501 RepID=UPI001CBD6685|nr:hypothetical protein [Sutcliffiella deserti]